MRRVGPAAVRRGRAWVDGREPASWSGTAIDAWRRYREIDGPLQSALLSLYLLVAVFPALLVMEEYLASHPGALADHLVRHYGLSATTGTLLRSVLIHDHAHELGSALFAIAGALFFGLGFGRVLQLVHARAWRIHVPARPTDQVWFAAVLLGLYGLILLLLVQLTELEGTASWARGGFGVVLAIYFWGAIGAALVVGAASVSPSLAQRRNVRSG